MERIDRIACSRHLENPIMQVDRLNLSVLKVSRGYFRSEVDEASKHVCNGSTLTYGYTFANGKALVPGALFISSFTIYVYFIRIMYIVYVHRPRSCNQRHSEPPMNLFATVAVGSLPFTDFFFLAHYFSLRALTSQPFS